MSSFQKMGDHTSMKDVFIQSQTGLQGHGKLMKTLNKLYEKTEFEAFWSEFQHYLKYAMIIFKREPAVERMIDFVSKFVPTLCKKTIEKAVASEEDGDESVQEEDSVGDNRLLQEMFDFLLASHSARDRGVRFRCCQLINKLLANLGEDAQIDDELYDKLYECMLERLKDKCPMVRYHAVLAMARLQDPADENCPVIKAYLFLLNCDPNADVRRAVLSSIAPSTKTLASIIGRTRDVKDTVRKTAYEILAEKIHIKALSIASRLQLINEGLNDRSEMVKQACSGKLLQAWMRTVGGNILDLLKSLDVEDSTDVCSRVLETLFKASSIQDMMTSFNILDEKLLIPVDALTSESALYWQTVCKFIHGMGTDGDEYMEKVLPTAVDFCVYMQRYVNDLKTVDDPEIQLGREFIIEQLLLITSYMDTADVASKKALETLLHNMLMVDHVSHRLVKFIITQICTLRGTGENMVAYFAETVSEIREPITIVEKDIEEEQKRQINLKIAGIRVQLNQLREDLDEAVKGQDFEKAANLKVSISQLDAEKKELLETSEPVREEVRTEKNDPFTLMKCQTIISEMLQQLKLSNVSSTLQMLIESQIVPGIQNEDAEVRNIAMQALGLCCYFSRDLLVTYIPLFMQASQIDVEGVRVTALNVLFDLLLIYGLEIVDASEGSSNESAENPNSMDGVTSETTSTSSDSRNGIASKLVAIICSFLDGESSDLRNCAAEGLAKLLLSGRVVSSKILSHLILLWYNPLSEDDTYLRDCLGTFFPLYALASRSNQEVVEEAFLPTLRTLLNAPATSPLAEVDVNNVAELLVQLTNTKLLTANQNSAEISMDNPGHDNLSETVCNEILSKPESAHVKLWVRILNQMDVSPDNEVVLKDLRILAYKMCRTVKEKNCLRGLQKFEARINELASKFVGDNDDLENIDIEPVGGQTDNSADESQDISTLTPKRKRVRGLYSQNMTLAMESEAELDIADDSTVDVDASCLMSRTSVETPSRRSRKNTTTTEITEEDVFLVPNGPQKTVISSEAGNKETVDKVAELANEVVEPAESESPRSKTPERGRPVDKKATSPKKTGSGKSPVKPKEKRKASRSPPGASPEKRLTSESPARRSQEKRKASKSPATDRKRVSKSPARSASSSSRKVSSSPEKRSSKSPIKEAGERRQSKSPVKSPVRGNAGKRKSSTSPVKSPDQKEKSSPAPAKKSKESEKAQAPNAKTPLAAKKTNESKKSELPERKKSASSNQDSKNVKAVEKNVRKALPKSAEKTRSASSTSSETKSPRTARGVKPSDTTKGSATTNSPRPARKAGNKLAADTPEVSRRVSTRSLANTPDIGSQRGRGTPKGRSIAETPENVMKQKPEQKKTNSKVGAGKAVNPVVRLNKIKTTELRVTRGSPRASASSASESSPEKAVKSTPRTTRAKVLSTDESFSSSPDSAKQSKPKKDKPVNAKKTTADTTTDEDEEEVSFRRKAKPSRRSATASASTSMVVTPAGGRTTRSSLSQSSIESPTVRSPRNPRPGVPVAKQPVKKGPTATGKKAEDVTASRRPARGGESSQDSTISLLSSQKTTTSSQRSTLSSQRSTISSSQKSTASSQRSTVSGKSDSSQTSRMSSRSSVATNASRRSKSADSGKTGKVTAPVTKVTRSAVATKPTRETRAEPGKLKRPLRSKPSERK